MGIEQFAVDVEKEDQGDWIEHPAFPGISVKVRSIHNPDYRRFVNGRLRKLSRKYGQDPIPVQLTDNLEAEALAKYALVDWDGLGEPFSTEKAYEWLSDRRYRKFRDFVQTAAASVGDSELVDMEEDTKNSETASSGKQAGGGTSKHS